MDRFQKWWEENKQLLTSLRLYREDVFEERLKLWMKKCWERAQSCAPLPASIQEALNSGDGTYKP